MAAPTRFRLNGMPQETAADPAMPLLYFLRGELRLKGTRFGCGGEGCGACTVLVDGEPAYACTKTLLELQGREVTTVETRADREVHAVQHALVEANAGQCGYCLSGIAMSAAAVLKANPRPTRADIAQALRRNLCRCGAHTRIIAAVEAAARALATEDADA